MSKPLWNLLEKDRKFHFDELCMKSFNELKTKLIVAPIIIAPDWNLLFELMCNTSDFAMQAKH